MKPRLLLVVTDDWSLWSHRIGLAEAALTLADAPARPAAMGAEGRRRAETEFASDLIRAETLKVCERALAPAG